MRRSVVPCVLGLCVTFGWLPVTVPAQELSSRPFLRKVIQLDESQLAAVEAGEVVTKLLPSPEASEIAAFGVVKTAGNQDLLLDLAKDVQRFRKAPHILQLGRFSEPPVPDDLSGLTFPPDDIAALKKCRPGSCDLKLGTKGLELAGRTDWSAPDAGQQAVAILTQEIVGQVAAYARGGTDAMGDIRDKQAARTRADEYRMLLARSPYLVEYVKEFNDYLVTYPDGSLPGVEDIHYWSKDTFGVKTVVSAHHMTLYQEPRRALIADKLLAASRYFYASLELTAATPTPDGNGLYLMTLYRARLDLPTGMLAGVVVGKVRAGVETAVRENLEVARKRLAAGR